jgi:hypothetical protein
MQNGTFRFLGLESEIGVGTYYGEQMSRSIHKITPPAKRANNKDSSTDSTLHELLPEKQWAIMQHQASLLQLLTHTELRILPHRDVDQMPRHVLINSHICRPRGSICAGRL